MSYGVYRRRSHLPHLHRPGLRQAASATVAYPTTWTLRGRDWTQQNTTATNDLSGDGYTWAQGTPLVVDQYGKLIAWAQRQNGGTKRHVLVVSNDNGVTWSEPTRTGFYDASGEGFLIRGAQAYDATHDLLHVVWVLDQADGAVIYRAYSLTRDVGTHDITGVTRARGFQPELGVAGLAYEAPVALWCADVGKLVIGWSCVSASKAEYRLTMRAISNDAGDATGSNWVAPFNEASGAGATDTMGSSGLVKYSCPAKSATSRHIFLSLARKPSTAATHASDLCWVSTQGTGSGTIYYNQAAWSSGNGDWRGGLSAALANDGGFATVSAIQRSGTDAGYSLKYQLISRLAYDAANDEFVPGCSTWKDDTNGDTWTLWRISGSGSVSSAIDVYSGGAANTDGLRDIFVTGDVMYDSQSGHVVSAYTNLMAHAAYLSTYDHGTAVVSGYLAYYYDPVDVPTLYETRVNGKLAILFRTFNAAATSNPPTYTPPYVGYYVTVNYDGPTNITSSDSAALTELVALALSGPSDAATATDAESALAAAVSALDSAAVSEAVALALAVADTASVAEAVAIALSASDSASTSDSESVNTGGGGTTPSSSDSATLSEAQSIAVTVSDTESLVLGELAALALSQGDTATATEIAAIAFGQSDSASVTEGGVALSAAVASAELAALAEAMAIGGALTSTDAAALAEAAVILGQAHPITTLYARSRAFSLAAPAREFTLSAVV